MSGFNRGCLPPVPRGGKWEGRTGNRLARGRRGRRGCEKVRIDVEGRGPGEKGRAESRQGSGRLFARAPQVPAAFPAALGPAPQSGPHPTAYSAPEAGQGKYPPRGLLVPERVCCLRILRTLASTRVQSLQPRLPPHQLRPRTRTLGGPASCLCCPQPGTPLSGGS